VERSPTVVNKDGRKPGKIKLIKIQDNLQKDYGINIRKE
jgi:hypothetical protein